MRQICIWITALALTLAGCVPGKFPLPDEMTTAPEAERPFAETLAAPGAPTPNLSIPIPSGEFAEGIEDSRPVMPTPTDPALQEILALATADLAARLGVDVELVHLLEMGAVNWPDASLGCPQPGTVYAQEITPGYRLILEVGGHIYTYHSDAGRQVMRCEITGSTPGKGDPNVQDGWPSQPRDSDVIIVTPHKGK